MSDAKEVLEFRVEKTSIAHLNLPTNTQTDFVPNGFSVILYRNGVFLRPIIRFNTSDEAHEWARKNDPQTHYARPITFTQWIELNDYMQCDQCSDFIVHEHPQKSIFTILKQDRESENYDYEAFKRSHDLIHLATTKIAMFDSMNYVIECLRNQIYNMT